MARLSLLVVCASLSVAVGNGSALGNLLSSSESRSVAETPAVLRAVRMLRGGQQAAAAGSEVVGTAAAAANRVPAPGNHGTSAVEDDVPLSRLRVSVLEGDTVDTTTVELNAATMAALGLVEGDTVQLQGKKRRKTVCVAVATKKIERGQARISALAAINLRCGAGESLIISPLLELADAQSIMLIPISESLMGFEGDPFEQALKPFLHGEPPLAPGDIIDTPCGEHSIRWKVMETLPVLIDDVEQMEAQAVAMKVKGWGDEIPVLVTRETEVYTEYQGMREISEMSAFDDETVGYEDVGGCEKELSMLKELVELPLKHPEVFGVIGVRPPRGVLMHGPPGSGKTLIAKAVRTETGVTFYDINGPEVMSKKGGEAESALRDVFMQAQANAPAIIFIDEIDALAPKREKAQGEAEKRIVSQLLTLLDNMSESKSVVVMAATNRANMLEPALRRFGRFDREISLGVPDIQGRLDILRKHAAKLRLSAEVDLAKVADDTHGYAGADLSQLVTEAAMQCVREKAGDIDVDVEDVEAETLEAMIVKPKHLEYAMTKCSPSSLRDKVVEIPDCSWKDVGGLYDVKREMTETLQYPLKYAAKYARYGMSPSKGMLLYGPSGCGKTLVAKAIANEVKSNFISVKGPELLSMWFGESESNVRELFNKARGAAPCILFFDEIDSIAKPRGSGGAGGGEAGDRIVNQILTEIDGVGSKKSVFIIAATNRPDMLDSAIMRPGRLDQLVYLPLPDLECRLQIFRACTRNSPLADDLNLEQLATDCRGFSGADIAEVCQRACKLAIRQNIAEAEVGNNTVCSELTKCHFDEAMLTARKSVSQADIKKFEMFRASMKAGKS